MKKNIFILLLIFISFNIYSRPQIQEQNSFRLMGNIPLYENPNFQNMPKAISLNHEGGIKVNCIELGKSEKINSQKGQWIKVVIEKGFWTDESVWIEPYEKFWIFILDETEIFDFE